MELKLMFTCGNWAHRLPYKISDGMKIALKMHFEFRFLSPGHCNHSRYTNSWAIYLSVVEQRVREYENKQQNVSLDSIKNVNCCHWLKYGEKSVASALHWAQHYTPIKYNFSKWYKIIPFERNASREKFMEQCECRVSEPMEWLFPLCVPLL